MIHVSLGGSHVRKQVEKLNGTRLHPLLAKPMKALPALACASGIRKGSAA